LLYRLGWLRTERVPVPVIVVGNVIAGGAGKTPVVMAVVQHLRARGLQVGVVSRGYGRRTDDCREVLADSDPLDVGDEPALIRHATRAPVFVARKRIEAARACSPSIQPHRSSSATTGCSTWRWRAISRSACSTTGASATAGDCPPAPCAKPGRARSTWCCTAAHSRLSSGGYTATRRLAPYALAHDGSRVPLDSLVGQPLDRHGGHCTARGLFQHAARSRPHAGGVRRPARSLRLRRLATFRATGQTLVCTEKDAVKLWRQAPDALAVPLEFTPSPEFFNALDAKLSSLDGYQAA
jgi:tetraacyldisaccharide 4'-kinase